jgi:hypothetical protein
MVSGVHGSARRRETVAELAVVLAAVTVAILSCRTYAGCWNDGSRLATVEALIDYRTLAIDDSIFVKIPSGKQTGAGSPYPANYPHPRAFGTGDMLFIQGRYYSDKSPVPALLMAGLYQGWQWCTGLTVRDRPDWFCYTMTLLSSGAAYVVAVWSLFRITGLVDLRLLMRLCLTGSFALATVALAYVRHTNNHIVLLAITAALFLGLLHLARKGSGENRTWLLVGLGNLAGLGYTIDLGAGPVLLVCTLGLVGYRCRRVGPVMLFISAALPWLVLHHSVNYAVGGTWKPANAVPEYFQWPGCSFNVQNMTGGWSHPTFRHFLTYAAALLVGKNGFLGHNLPLYMAVAALLVLLWRRPAELPEIIFAGCCCGGIWLAYALTSTNYSGSCCSIRWFVPLLAPGYFALAVFLRQCPQYTKDFLILTGWSVVIAGLCWYKGPWMNHMVPYYWVWQAGALVTWTAYRFWRRRPSPLTGFPGGSIVRRLNREAFARRGQV